ncbi:hypothetical protein JCM15519_28760 [Fundidesulfovibrio butyratiphilus]
MSMPRVMIVEDEAVSAMAMQSMVKKLGCLVCGCVPTGEEALEVAAAQHPDVILMDVRLEGRLDGIETTSRIKKMGDVPVIYITAFSDSATRDRARATNPLAFFVKPLDMCLLRNILAPVVGLDGCLSPCPEDRG